MSVDLSCSCPESDRVLPKCTARATQEDMLCDPCRAWKQREVTMLHGAAKEGPSPHRTDTVTDFAWGSA